MGLSIYSLFFEFDIVIVIFIVLGSLLPDIDTPYLKLGRYNVAALLMKHRGRMHTIIGLLSFSFLAYMVSTKAMYGLMFGYVLHMFADTLTPMGIMWLFPFNNEYYSLSSRKINPREYEGLIIGICLLWLFLGKGKGGLL